MKRAAQPALSVEGQQVLAHYTQALQRMEDLTAVRIHNYLSDLRQCIAWCECCFREEWDGQPFTPQAVAPPLLIWYRTYLQTILWLEPSTVNRTLMSRKRDFAWVVKTHMMEHDPTINVKFVHNV